MTGDHPLAEGLHDSVVTTALVRRLALQPDLQASVGGVDSADQADVLAAHLGRSILRGLRAPSDTDEAGRLALVRKVLDLLDAADDTPVDGVRRLLALDAP